MAAELRANLSLECRFTPVELAALAVRLRARADTLVPSDNPEEQRDLSIAALVVEEVLQLHADFRESAAITEKVRQTLGLAGA